MRAIFQVPLGGPLVFAVSILIGLNIVAIVLESEAHLYQRHQMALYAFEIFAVIAC